jgi:hypothetical protein
MLVHSPTLPLVIDYFIRHDDLSEEDEEGLILALKQHDRVRRVRLQITVTSLQRLIVAMDEEYPILEYLVIMPYMEDNSRVLIFPETLQVPHLRHLTLDGFSLPMESRLLTTAVGLVTLYLLMGDPSTYFHPNAVLQWILFMPQLETLVVDFSYPVLNRDVKRQLTRMRPTAVTLSNLHYFRFQGVSTYLEALVHHITTPRLEKLEIYFFNQLTFSVPRLMQFINTTENLRFNRARFEFCKGRVSVGVYPHSEAETYPIAISVGCWHLDWQVHSMAQISNSLGQMFSVVEHLTLKHEAHRLSSEEHNAVDRTEWHKLLRSFNNVKTLRIGTGLVEELSRSLNSDDGELPLELLSELQEITYSWISSPRHAFSSFIDARRNAGLPIHIHRYL